MGSLSKLGIESRGIFIFAILYLLGGVANFAVLGMHGLGLFHVALVAVLSLIASFGLFRGQKWSLWFVVGLFFIVTTYGAIMLDLSLQNYAPNSQLADLLGVVAWAMYLVLTWLSTVYIAARRKHLK